MRIFLGTHVRKIDRNGRVSIPSKFRALLESEGGPEVHVFPSKHDADVLVGCGENYLSKLYDRLERQDPTSETYEDVTYSVFADVETFSIDGDGRIVLPPHLRDKMGIDKEVAFVGRGDQFSLMRPDRVGDKKARSRERSKEAHEGLLALPDGGRVE
ncbi:MAG: division/cell wall cluster transcriptional repressor MraZ [Minwuia sp.]|uniref:division/cell wall cluster transcriptional repressor MraZ n=1 Tax=Minwuia sp. TaxID=2493630 RepID=UPI003A8B0DAC